MFLMATTYHIEKQENILCAYTQLPLRIVINKLIYE